MEALRLLSDDDSDDSLDSDEILDPFVTAELYNCLMF